MPSSRAAITTATCLLWGENRPSRSAAHTSSGSRRPSMWGFATALTRRTIWSVYGPCPAVVRAHSAKAAHLCSPCSSKSAARASASGICSAGKLLKVGFAGAVTRASAGLSTSATPAKRISRCTRPPYSHATAVIPWTSSLRRWAGRVATSRIRCPPGSSSASGATTTPSPSANSGGSGLKRTSTTTACRSSRFPCSAHHSRVVRSTNDSSDSSPSCRSPGSVPATKRKRTTTPRMNTRRASEDVNSGPCVGALPTSFADSSQREPGDPVWGDTIPWASTPALSATPRASAGPCCPCSSGVGVFPPMPLSRRLTSPSHGSFRASTMRSTTRRRLRPRR